MVKGERERSNGRSWGLRELRGMGEDAGRNSLNKEQSKPFIREE
jgi:hypothetical protein